MRQTTVNKERTKRREPQARNTTDNFNMACRAFLDPGMAVAWRYKSMESLVRVLPENRRGSTWQKQLVSFFG